MTARDDRAHPAPARGLSRRALLAGAAAASVPLLGAPPAAAALSEATGASGRTVAGAPAAPNKGAPLGPYGSSLQPYATYWFPDSFPEGREPDPGAVWRSLKQWRPEDDPDLPHNVSTVPRAERFTPVPAHPGAHDRARLSALVSFSPTAGNPSQGAPTADFYAFTHWAYLEELVFWGGSAGEGIILAPNGPVVDAAHRHGVRVLGTVFLPPVAYGGDLTWTRELVQRDSSGGFPLADRLALAARSFGFDGWFVNAETEGGDAALAREFAAFLRHLRAAAPELSLTWYDAFDAEGRVGWQGELNDRNALFFHGADGPLAHTMYLDFRWREDRTRPASSARYAAKLGRSPYELWAGVDVQANGWGTEVDWEAVLPEGRDPLVSYGLYRPEWTWHSQPAPRSPGAFHARDNRFWTGEDANPAAPVGPDGWHPAALHIADRSTVTGLPFATAFTTGHGTDWYEEGRPTGTGAWHHLALQDRLPGRRWAVHTVGRRPSVGFDFEAAWRGGSSLLVDGEPTAPVTVELYRTAVRLPAGGATVELTHRAEPGSAAVVVELAVACAEPAGPGARPPFRWLPAATVRAEDGWTSSAVRLDGRRFGRRTVRVLGVRLTAAATDADRTAEGPDELRTAHGPGHTRTAERGGAGGALRWRLGMLAVHAGPPRAPGRPGLLRVTASRLVAPDTAELRLRWRPARGGGTDRAVRHYEVHQVLPGGQRRFLGGTCAPAYFVPALRRSGAERRTRIEVRAVGA
ncbi:endo-beta-N-acetylglucosaminidase, partial [Streptomyces sp. URMC 123]|uniref:endo-beta-N-acetylglucosaminidase n=1 Tax=Streptomyces sp. URMC 123 TaxID=3423403 RepID=UPI003F1AFD7D